MDQKKLIMEWFLELEELGFKAYVDDLAWCLKAFYARLVEDGSKKVDHGMIFGNEGFFSKNGYLLMK